MNPLVPQLSDVLWASTVILNVILVIAALLSVAKAAGRGGWFSKVLLIIFVPFIGPIVALMTTRGRHAPARSSEADSTFSS